MYVTGVGTVAKKNMRRGEVNIQSDGLGFSDHVRYVCERLVPALHVQLPFILCQILHF